MNKRKTFWLAVVMGLALMAYSVAARDDTRPVRCDAVAVPAG